MKALRNLMLVAVVVGTMTVMGARSFAGPLLPNFPSDWSVTPWVAGQSKLVSPFNPTGDYINVDWIVFWDASGVWGYPGSFVYLYQIENTQGSSGVRAFTVRYGGAQSSDEIGIKDGDLDTDNLPSWKGHNSSNFPNLLGETEPGGAPLGTATLNYNASVVVGGVSWTNNLSGGITRTNESLVFYIIDPRPPTYGTATAHDTANWWGKVTFGATTYGDPVPVPSPEPATVFLMLGAIGTLVWRRRKN
jgi:hypothetical protein